MTDGQHVSRQCCAPTRSALAGRAVADLVVYLATTREHSSELRGHSDNYQYRYGAHASALLRDSRSQDHSWIRSAFTPNPPPPQKLRSETSFPKRVLTRWLTAAAYAKRELRFRWRRSRLRPPRSTAATARRTRSGRFLRASRGIEGVRSNQALAVRPRHLPRGRMSFVLRDFCGTWPRRTSKNRRYGGRFARVRSIKIKDLRMSR
jgi:hypothetical protein